jgi:hypothetical protein
MLAVLLLAALVVFGAAVFFFKAKRADGPLSVKAGEELRKAGDTPASAPEPALTPEDWRILRERLDLSAGLPLGDQEKEVLARQVDFKTGLAENLPSHAWSTEQFKAMIEEQEKFYKVPLPRSYKNKLFEHFEKSYAPGRDAFMAGDLLTARDRWAAALAFPVYADDIQKHRGVALTMMRAFINDTLSKIGSINTALVERGVRELEAVLTNTYQGLREALGREDWARAAAICDALIQQIDALEKPAEGAAEAPAYPPQSLAGVDQGIQAALQDLLNPPQPAVADLDPMRRDIGEKLAIARSRLPGGLDEARARYERAVALIDQEKWFEAARELENIQHPPALRDDARRKFEILERLQRSTPQAG